MSPRYRVKNFRLIIYCLAGCWQHSSGRDTFHSESKTIFVQLSLNFWATRPNFLVPQPHPTPWQTGTIQESSYPTSARIEEVPMASGSTPGPVSHPAHDSTSYYQNHRYPSTYGEFFNQNSAPIQTTTYISHGVGSLAAFPGDELT